MYMELRKAIVRHDEKHFVQLCGFVGVCIELEYDFDEESECEKIYYNLYLEKEGQARKIMCGGVIRNEDSWRTAIRLENICDTAVEVLANFDLI